MTRLIEGLLAGALAKRASVGLSTASLAIIEITSGGIMPKELTGIAAFAPIAIADAFDAARDPILNLYHRPNDPSVTFQIKSADIVKLIPGGEEDGCRLLQLILRTGSIVETKVEMLRSVRNLQDPTLKHLTAAAISTHSSLPST